MPTIHYVRRSILEKYGYKAAISGKDKHHIMTGGKMEGYPLTLAMQIMLTATTNSKQTLNQGLDVKKSKLRPLVAVVAFDSPARNTRSSRIGYCPACNTRSKKTRAHKA